MRGAATDLLGMINDLLDLAKVEAGKVELRFGEVRVDEVFSALRGLFRPLIAGDAVALVFDAADELPVLLSDEAKLAQILRNLIANALKFTERGEVRVTARREGDGGRVLFAVEDTGVGIAPADHKRIFEEFSQVPHPFRKDTTGTGLGLPLSRRFAELLGGTLTVESALGRGATFTLALPAEAPGAVAAPSIAAEAAAGRRLLVIDDEPAARYVLRQALRDTGASVIEAEDGESGLERALDGRPDLIFLDLRLPGIDGYEVLEQLTSEPATRDIPVVIVTSLAPAALDRPRLAPARAILGKEEISRERLGDLVAALAG
jgi:CheY-like chemotaxis protein/two-component sensor histidine kinase